MSILQTKEIGRITFAGEWTMGDSRQSVGKSRMRFSD